MFKWIEYHIYLPVFAFAVELWRRIRSRWFDELARRTTSVLLAWSAVLFYSSQLTRVRVVTWKKNWIYSHAFSGWNNAVHRLSWLKSETREFDCRREMSHSFPFLSFFKLFDYRHKICWLYRPVSFLEWKKGKQ